MSIPGLRNLEILITSMHEMQGLSKYKYFQNRPNEYKATRLYFSRGLEPPLVCNHPSDVGMCHLETIGNGF